MAGLDQMRQKQEYVLAQNRNRNIRLSFHNRSMSYLEGVFSRGDRRLSAVVEEAFRKGCRLDGWDEYFDFQKWAEAFRESGLDPAAYLGEHKLEELLAWDFLDVGVSKELLVAEYKAVREHTGV
jgi:hypothetical protein